jgi:hypothetical protein
MTILVLNYQNLRELRELLLIFPGHLLPGLKIIGRFCPISKTYHLPPFLF